ncbi:MAG: NAD(P)-dependent oxidoreductase, partial [Acidobacteria bacterium]|nr:NAD(P)-dependent oxidoreductase [Acidobacteriota bacterium]
MRVIITGAAGFIGKEIVAELEKNNIEVIQIIRSKLNSESNYQENISKIFFADITNYENFREIERLENVDAVIHSAGLAHQFKDIEKKFFELVNVEGTRNVVELGVRLKVKHFILISSSAVYGIKKKEREVSQGASKIFIIDENTACIPETDYAQSKLVGEKISRKICEKNEIPLTIFRLAPVIGEGNTGNVARLITTIDNRRFFWIGTGTNLKTLIYKRDVARACLKILKEKKGETEIFNLAAEPVKMRKFVDEIAVLLDKRIPKVFISPSVLKTVFR